MAEQTYVDVVWTAGDVITEAKLDNMVANDRAVDAMNQGVRFTERANPDTPPTNTIHLYAKDKSGVPALYAINDAGRVYEIGEQTPTFVFPIAGSLVVGTSLTSALIATRALTLTKAYAYVKQAPTGAAIIVDINRNGSSIWGATPANRLTIADGLQSGSQTAFDTATLAEGDVLTPDIDQIGSTVGGADLTIQLTAR